MEQFFLESNFSQTIIMTIIVCVTTFIYWHNKVENCDVKFGVIGEMHYFCTLDVM